MTPACALLFFVSTARHFTEIPHCDAAAVNLAILKKYDCNRSIDCQCSLSQSAVRSCWSCGGEVFASFFCSVHPKTSQTLRIRHKFGWLGQPLKKDYRRRDSRRLAKKTSTLCNAFASRDQYKSQGQTPALKI